MATVYAPPSFSATTLHGDLYRYLFEELGEEYVALLEFHAPSASNGPSREVDLAIAGHYGLEVIEIKNISGAVVASINGEWVAKQRGKPNYVIPLNGARRENPYDQADENANQLGAWIRAANLSSSVTTFPAVLIPEHHPESNLPVRSFVRAYNGVDDMARNLRSMRSFKGSRPAWNPGQWHELAKRLDLAEVGWAKLEGLVRADAVAKQSVRKALVRVGQKEIETDKNGSFSLSLPVGAYEVRVSAPPGFLDDEREIRLGQGPNRIEIILQAVPPVVQEAPDTSGAVDRLAARVEELLTKLDVRSEARDTTDSDTVRKLATDLKAQYEKEREDREALLMLITEQMQSTPRDEVVTESLVQGLGASLSSINVQISELSNQLSALHRPHMTAPDLHALTSQLTLLEGLRREQRTIDVVRERLVLKAGQDRPQGTEQGSPRAHQAGKNVSASARKAVAHNSPPGVGRRLQPRRHLAPLGVVGLLLALGAGALLMSILPWSRPNPAQQAAPLSALTDLSTIGGAPSDGKAPEALGVTEPSPPSEPVTSMEPVPPDVSHDDEPAVVVAPARPAPNEPPETTNTNPQSLAARSLDNEATRLPGTPASTSTSVPLPGVPVGATQPVLELLPGVAPISRNNCPVSHPLKGNISSNDERIVHRPGQDYYDATNPERCFATLTDAQADGFRPSLR